MSFLVAKTTFFSLYGSEKLNGESVCRRVIRRNMRLAYMAHQAAGSPFSREIQDPAARSLSPFRNSPLLPSEGHGRRTARLELRVLDSDSLAEAFAEYFCAYSAHSADSDGMFV